MEKVLEVSTKLTETKIQPTKGNRIDTRAWARWFQINLCNDAAIQSMVETSASWVRAVQQNDSPRWLVLLGSSGIGKTMIANRIWQYLKTRRDFRFKGDYDPVKLYWPKFVDKLRDGGHYGLLSASYDWPFAYLDDVCAESMTEFSTEKLHNLMGSRCGKWTIVTSNKSLEQIAQLDSRISSRMIRDGANIVEAHTLDYNLR